MSDELLRYINSMHMEKGIPLDHLYDGIEAALTSAARKRYGQIEELRVRIDRKTGVIRLMDGDIPFGVMSPADYGRIAAQTAKQVMIQRIREAESEVVFGEFAEKQGSLVNGIIQRIERGTVICNIGKTDAILPRQEQIPSETYRPNERLRCYVTQVKRKGSKVLVILSRTHPDLVRELFGMEVPEIDDRIVEIRALVREPGYRTKIAVTSNDNRVDAVGACVGVRGSRIRNIVEELCGEKIDIVRWSDDPGQMIRNALSPAEIDTIEFDRHHQRARVIVPADQLSLAIGRKGQNVRLSTRLTGWDLDIMTVEQHRIWRQRGRAEIAGLPGVDETTQNHLLMAGFESFRDILQLGEEKLQEIPDIDAARARILYEHAIEGHRKRIEDEAREAAEARARRDAQPANAPAPDGLTSAPDGLTPSPVDATEADPADDESPVLAVE